MGAVISIDEWKGRREPRLGAEARVAGRPEVDATIRRLERAVAGVEARLKEVMAGGAVPGEGAPPRSVQLESELLAILGAVSMDRLDEAALRAERLASRLEGISRSRLVGTSRAPARS